MKKNSIHFILLFYILNLCAQEPKKISKEFTFSTIENIDISKVYDSQTGKKIGEKEFHKLTKNSKKFTLEKVINANGKVEKYLFTSNVKSDLLKRDITKRPKKGEKFPDFNLKTIFNDNIDFAKIKGKIIIIRFDLFADNFRFKKQEVIGLDKKINSLGKENFQPIIIFISSKNEVLKGFDIKNSNFSLVSDGMNFNERFNITRYPTTIVIDTSGNLVDYFKKSEEIDLKKILNQEKKPHRK